MNEEKEELKKQVEKLQAQVTLSNAQVGTAGQREGQLACPHGAGRGVWRVPGENGSQDPRWFSPSSATKFLWSSASPFPSLTFNSGLHNQSHLLCHRMEVKDTNRETEQREAHVSSPDLCSDHPQRAGLTCSHQPGLCSAPRGPSPPPRPFPGAEPGGQPRVA